MSERKMDSSERRRYEIDALRVIALVLLIIYHVFICYQPFAKKVSFIQYDEFLTQYWFIGELVNVWRIPVLFLISGLAVGFVLRRRSLKELFHDRMLRLVPPLIFGALFICPVSLVIHSIYHDQGLKYTPNPGHLWFLQNLVSYTILLLPLIWYIKRRPDNSLIRALRWATPIWLLVVFPLPLMLETALTKPPGFAFYPLRFFYGLICYAAGFLMVSTGDRFWVSIRRICHVALLLAIIFYLERMKVNNWSAHEGSHWTTGFESAMWMLAFLGYGSLFLSRRSRLFGYLNQAVFPIYIIHLPVQQAVALGIFRWGLAPGLTLSLHVLLTLAICWLSYEYVIRRLPIFHGVMGMRSSQPKKRAGGLAKVGTVVTSYVLAPLLFLAQVGFFVAITAVQVAKENQPGQVASDTIWAAARNNDVENLKEFLIAGGGPVDQPDPVFKLPALNWAALNGAGEAVIALIEAGADVDVRIEDGSTPLGHAAFMGHPEIVAYLIGKGADLNSINSHQATPLDNTHANWPLVLGVSKMLGLTVKREEWEAGKRESRKILEQYGGKRKAELD